MASFVNILEIVAERDLNFYLLQDHLKKMMEPLSPIDKAIDRTTGYDKQKLEKDKGIALELINKIIECKYKLGEGIETEEKLIKEINNLN